MHIEADIAFPSCIAFLLLVFVNETVVKHIIMHASQGMHNDMLHNNSVRC